MLDRAVPAFPVTHQTAVARLASRAASFVPALVLLDPLLIWPLLYAEQLAKRVSIISSGADHTSYLLHKVWFPPLLVLVVLLFALTSPQKANLRLRQISFWVIGFLWAGLSVVWAIEPSISANRLILQIIIAATLWFAFMTADDRKRILDAVFWVMVVTAIVNLASVLTQVPGPLGYEGIYEHKNNLGAFATLTLLIAALKFPDAGRVTRWACFALIPVCLVLLVLSQSKTSAGLLPLSLALGAAAILLNRLVYLSVALFPILLVLVAALIIVILDATVNIDGWDIAQLVTGDATFTGRTDIWNYALRYISDQPFMGYGFRSFWDIGASSPSREMGLGFVATTTHGHNGYIDILLNGGLIALFLFVPVLWIGLQACGRIAQRHIAKSMACASLLLFFIFYNLLETSFFYGAHTVFVLFQIIWLHIIFTQKEEAQPLPLIQVRIDR
ncbi:MAG: O-antigen ligase family protein [Pseudomonadota bacterium]